MLTSSTGPDYTGIDSTYNANADSDSKSFFLFPFFVCCIWMRCKSHSEEFCFSFLSRVRRAKEREARKENFKVQWLVTSFFLQSSLPAFHMNAASFLLPSKSYKDFQ